MLGNAFEFSNIQYKKNEMHKYYCSGHKLIRQITATNVN